MKQTKGKEKKIAIINHDLFELLKENSYKQLDWQNSAIESIEVKTTSLLTTLATIMTIMATLATVYGVNIKWNNWLVSGCIFLALSVIFIFLSLLCRHIKTPANIKKFLKENLKLPFETTRSNFLDDCEKSVGSNSRKIKLKGIFFNLALLFFVLSTAVISVDIISGELFSVAKDTQNMSDNQDKPTIPTTTPKDNPTPSQDPDTGLPTNRQDTTTDLFKGTEEYIKKTNK